MNTSLTAIRSMLADSRPLLLDGGLGSELVARGYDLDSPLWSAALIAQAPDAIVAVHRAYLDAGAQCVISASYQASVAGLEAAGYVPGAIAQFFADTTALARRACDEFMLDNPDCRYRPLVAASIGPYGAYLADGSEYRGNYAVDDAVLRDFHAQRLRWLDASGADLLAVETIPDLREAALLAQLLENCTTPAWVSFCCRDAGHLHDGNLVSDAVALFEGLPGVIAVGANCIAPDIVTELVANLRAAAHDKLVVVYPNSGAQYDAGRKRWRGQESPRDWALQALDWYRAGADLIGGCCRIGPEHIRQLATRTTWHC